jgi:hypothetical protein
MFPQNKHGWGSRDPITPVRGRQRFAASGAKKVTS